MTKSRNPGSFNIEQNVLAIELPNYPHDFNNDPLGPNATQLAF